jgi:hypothetical protein
MTSIEFDNKRDHSELATRGTDVSVNPEWLSNAYLSTGIPPSLNPQLSVFRPVVC